MSQLYLLLEMLSKLAGPNLGSDVQLGHGWVHCYRHCTTSYKWQILCFQYIKGI